MVRTTIIGLLYFFTIFVQHIALAAATGKRCQQCFVNFAVLFTQNWVSTQLSQKYVWGSHPQTPSLVSHAFRESVPSLNPPYRPLLVSQNLDPRLVIVLIRFQIKVREMFIGDILHIVILDFSADIGLYWLRVEKCSVLVWFKRNYGQLGPKPRLRGLLGRLIRSVVIT